MAHGQNAVNDFNLANELLREGENEEAFRIFKQLMDENPRSFAVYDHAMTALVNLKRFDEAIRLTEERLQRYPDDINTLTRLGEIYHISDEQEKALETWTGTLERHPDNLNAYRRIARTMNEYRLYREAITVYQRARERFNNPLLFPFELADNYLAVADYEPAMEVYLDALEADEQVQNRIKRQLLNYDEQQLYDIAILVTEERMDHHLPGTETDLAYRDLLVWLHLERGLYRRALVAARNLERYSNNEKHVLFRTGRELRNRQQFELAEEAFSYYLNLEHHPLQARSYEELSRTYQDHAAKLIDDNMDFGGATDSLYSKALQTIERLTTRYPRYERMTRTLVMQAELALDHLHDPDSAEEYFNKLKAVANSESDNALRYYIEGRILLFRADFSLARVALTRSNRLAGSGDLADKSRYYLGLGDFYNGDFTYARMQLRSLERQNHSWFANNALQLRYIIQDAYQDEGENASLRRYAHALYLYDTGNSMEAAGTLSAVLNEPAGGSLHTESILLLTRALRDIHPDIAFRVINRYIHRPSIRNNATERLLWERARIAELVHTIQQNHSGDTLLSGALLPVELIRDLFPNDDDYASTITSQKIPLSSETIVTFYEELLMNYPDGYYANTTRNRIRVLEQTSREI